MEYPQVNGWRQWVRRIDERIAKWWANRPASRAQTMTRAPQAIHPVMVVGLGSLSFLAYAGLLLIPNVYLEVAFLLVAPLFLFPHRVVMWVLVPLGWWRAAYVWASLSILNWNSDPRGGKLLVAALALHQRPNLEAITWIERRIPYHHFRGASVVAMGLIEAARGNMDAARQLLRSVAWLDSSICPRVAQSVAQRWLVADAASRDAWHSVALIASLPLSPSCRFMRAVAMRISAPHHAPGRMALLIHWLLCGHPVASYQYLRMAWNPVAPAQHPAWDSLAAVAAYQSVAYHPDDLLTVAAAWDDLLPSSACGHWPDRAVQMQIPWDRARALLIDTIQSDLALRIQASADIAPCAVLPKGRFTAALRQRVCDDLHRQLSEHCDRIKRATSAQPPWAPDEIWRVFAAIGDCYARIANVGGWDEEKTAFQTIHYPVVHVACHLSNDRHLPSPARGMFLWTVWQSRRAGTSEQQSLDENNAKCWYEFLRPSGLTFPVRRARILALAAIAVLLAAAFATVSARHSLGLAQVAYHCNHVEATVSKLRVNRGKSITYHGHYHFEGPDGTTYTSRPGLVGRSGEVELRYADYERAKKGKPIDVCYLPADPSWNAPSSSLGSDLFFSVGALWLSIGVGFIASLLAKHSVAFSHRMQQEAQRSKRGW